MGNKEGARQSVRPVVVCPNKAIDLSQSVSVSPNVRFTGEYAFIMSSTVINGKDSSESRCTLGKAQLCRNIKIFKLL